MSLNLLRNFISSANRAECQALGEMIRARFAELRATDPCLYVIEREYVDAASVAGMRGVEAPVITQWATLYRGQTCFLANSLRDYGGVLASLESMKSAANNIDPNNYIDRGARLAVFETADTAELYAKCAAERYKGRQVNFVRVRKVVKATGELVPLS